MPTEIELIDEQIKMLNELRVKELHKMKLVFMGKPDATATEIDQAHKRLEKGILEQIDKAILECVLSDNYIAAYIGFETRFITERRKCITNTEMSE